MSKMKPHYSRDDEDPKRTIAMIHPASQESVDFILAQDEDSPDGRSNWVWLRLPNGDLILGVFPQGDAYFAVEEDAAYPSNEKQA